MRYKTAMSITGDKTHTFIVVLVLAIATFLLAHRGTRRLGIACRGRLVCRFRRHRKRDDGCIPSHEIEAADGDCVLYGHCFDGGGGGENHGRCESREHSKTRRRTDHDELLVEKRQRGDVRAKATAIA